VLRPSAADLAWARRRRDPKIGIWAANRLGVFAVTDSGYRPIPVRASIPYSYRVDFDRKLVMTASGEVLRGGFELVVNYLKGGGVERR
jgi:hypothetical protein